MHRCFNEGRATGSIKAEFNLRVRHRMFAAVSISWSTRVQIHSTSEFSAVALPVFRSSTENRHGFVSLPIGIGCGRIRTD